MRVKCLAQEHNTMTPAWAQTWTTRSGLQHANHWATTPPISIQSEYIYLETFWYRNWDMQPGSGGVPYEKDRKSIWPGIPVASLSLRGVN